MDTHVVAPINIYEAKANLSALVSRAESGEEIVIARNGRPVARLVPLARRAPRAPGALAGKIWIADDFDSMSDEELNDWYGDGAPVR